MSYFLLSTRAIAKPMDKNNGMSAEKTNSLDINNETTIAPKVNSKITGTARVSTFATRSY